MKRDIRRSDCPVHCGLNLLGDRWTLVVIRDLLFTDKSTFTELLNSPEKIATNTLSNRLAKLSEHGLIKQATRDSRYKLTDKGFDLVPALMELAVWAEKYDATVVSVAEAYQQYQKDPQAFIAGLKAARKAS